MWWLFVVVVVVVVIAIVIFTSKGDSSSEKSGKSGKSPSSSGKRVLRITGDGAKIENYRMRGGRENYMIIADVNDCHKSENVSKWCEDMNYQKSYGMAFIYDERLGPNPDPFASCSGDGECERKPNTCPDGGYMCAFTERYNDEGSLIGITNAAGEELLDKMATDAWAGKWKDWTFAQTIKKDVEYKNGKLYLKSDGPNDIKSGDELTLELATSMGVPVMYFIALLIFMSESGDPKPDQIVLDVKGARQSFMDRMNSGGHFEGEKPPSEDKTVINQPNGEYKMSLDQNEYFCSAFGSKIIRCDGPPHAGERFTFVQNGDGFNIYTAGNSCSDYTHVSTGVPGYVRCNGDRDTPGTTYKAVDYIAGHKRLKMFNKANNKYCRSVIGDINSAVPSGQWDIRCDQDNIEDATTYVFHS